MKILVVDDSKAARMLIKSILSEYSEDVELIEAENGQEAVDAYSLYTPDVTFLDLTMPVMSGYDALNIIIKENPHAIVIILTADIQEKSVSRCVNAGAYMVLKKLPQKELIFKVLDDIRAEAGLEHE